jgi:hypothetical protein
VAFAEIVENGDMEPLVDEFLHADAADVTGPASDENFFHFQ